VGCAHVPAHSPAEEDTRADSKEIVAQKIVTDPVGKEGDESSKPRQIVMTDNGDITVRGIKLKNTKFDIPITINSRVEFWVDYFTGKGREHFTKYLERSEYFIPYITPVLKQNGMPQDLVYLAMIESGFNNMARSHAKAVGPWQFISATGKRYGLMVNWWVDERRDVRKSTLAALEYLRDLYGMFQSWELAAASYNAGEAKVARAIQRYGTKDFWVISRQRFLRPETRDYVPKIIAAAIVSKNRTQFGFPEEKVHPAADEALAGDGELVKVIKTEKPEEQLEKDPSNATTIASILEEKDNVDDDEEDSGPTPAITPATLMVNEQTPVESQPLAKPVPVPHMSKDGQVGGVELAEFDVQSPADLLKVARASGLSYQTVKSLNPELLRWCTPPTVSSYRLRLPQNVKERFLTTYNHVSFPRKVQFMAYRVRRGETLAYIARHFGIKVDPMSDLNGVSAKMPLRHGVEVLLPIPNDRSRSLASLDVRDPPEGHRRHRRGHYRVGYKKRQSARVSFESRSDS
jgi:membrane-bound lytic murein transglycosylase D